MAQSPETPDTALIVQGGGMRGVYSIGALAALEGFSEETGVDLRNAFSAGFGSSAGAINLAHYAAGHARDGIAIYTDKLTDGRFMPRLQPFDFQTARQDIGRVVRNGFKIVDIDRLANKVLQEQGRLTSFEGSIADNIYAVATDAETGVPIALRMSPEDPDLYEIFKATGALPVLYNDIVEIKGGRYVDGGSTSSVPLNSAVAHEPKPKHIVAILTREYGYRNKPHDAFRSFLYKSGVIALSRGVQSEMVQRLIGERHNEIGFNLDMARMEDYGGVDPVSGVSFTLVQPSDPERMTSRLTMDRDKIVGAAELGREDMLRALDKAVIPVD
ncbi:MAG TPA: patatin-like phospholipase family protein [Candidatus Saccharimonadales bacterium]|nr:patatin-like phospholipase family protein [Candidatus Saccharimonadales bacterium]